MTEKINRVTAPSGYPTKMIEFTIPHLGRFVPCEAFDGAWGYMLAQESRGVDYWIPTERVVSKPEFVVPRRARVFSTDLYRLGGSIIPYSELQRRLGDQFKGTWAHQEILMVEVWSDHGDDGHVYWRHEGYRFVFQKDLEITHGEGSWGWPLPACMCDRSDDWKERAQP